MGKKIYFEIIFQGNSFSLSWMKNDYKAQECFFAQYMLYIAYQIAEI